MSYSPWRLALRALADATFGPTLQRLFDFTIRFEEIFFGITPTAALLAIAPFFLARHKRRSVAAAAADCHLWAKLILSTTTVSLEITSAVLRATSNDVLSTTIPSHVVSSVAAVAMTFMLYYDHRYAIQSSAFISIYFGITMLLDTAKARTFFLRGGSRPGSIGSIYVAIAVTKLVLVGLAEIPKRYQSTTRKKLGKETTSGFWNRTLFIWLNSTFFFGFGNRLLVDDLPNLAPGFYSEHLSAKFRRYWVQYDGCSYRLIKTCTRSLLWSLLVPVPSRLLYIGFTICQPYIIQRILIYTGSQDKSSDETSALIGAYVLINLGVTISQVWFQHLNNRLVTRVRGILVSQIFRKNLLLKHKEAKRGAAATLIGTDIDGITTGIAKLHNTWACVVEIGASIYLTSSITGRAASLAIFPALIATGISAIVSRKSGTASKAWNRAIETRVSKTTSILTQIKGIKMLGIEVIIADLIQKLRETEVKLSKTARSLRVAIYASTPIAFAFTPIIVIAGSLFWTKFQDGLEASSTFTTLAFLSLVVKPMFVLLSSWPTIGTLLACFGRIDEFLLQDERRDNRNGRCNGNTNDQPLVPEPEDADCIGEKEESGERYPIQFSKALIAPSESKNGKVHVDASLERSVVTMVVGPTGCGKSTLLKALVGEANVVRGTVYVEDRHIAYCDQNVWLRNITLRDNIVGENAFEESWYNRVVYACMLADVDEFPHGDLTVAGSGGSNLSGGQKQRIALGRAIYSRSRVIVMEDMLSAVDRPSSVEILERLFGRKGLIRKLGITVVMATHSVEYLEYADAAITIDENGVGSLKRSRKAITEYMNMHLAMPDLTGVSDGATDDISAARHFNPAPPKPKASTSLRPQADWSLYSFYLGSMSKKMMLVWLLATAIASAMERVPDIFIRIWIEKAPHDKSWFLGYALLGVACVIGTAAFTWIYLICIVPGSSELLHRKLLDTVMHASFSFLSYTDTGSLLNRFSQDMSILSQELPMALMLVVYSSCLVTTELGIIFAGTRYAIVMLPVAGAALFALQLFYLRTSKQLRILDLETKTPLYTLLTEIIDGVQHIRSFGWQLNFYNKAMALVDHSQKPYYYMLCIQQWLLLVLGLGVVALSAALVAFALTFSSTSQHSLGLALLVAMQVSPVLANLVKHWVNLETSLGAISRLTLFMKETPSEPTDENEATVALPELWPNGGNIELVDVSSEHVTAEGRNVALRDVSISIKGGTKVGLVGRTGSGKSSLFLTLLNFLPYTGEVRIDGIEISDIPRHAIRSRITTITQDLMDLPGSVRDNIVPRDMNKAAGSRVDDVVIVDALRQVGLTNIILSRGGLDATLEDIGLSNGQKQLLALARAIIHNGQTKSKVVLVDEATSGVDTECEEKLQTVMADVFEHCTVLTIAHRLQTMNSADMLLELSDGYLVND